MYYETFPGLPHLHKIIMVADKYPINQKFTHHRHCIRLHTYHKSLTIWTSNVYYWLTISASGLSRSVCPRASLLTLFLVCTSQMKRAKLYHMMIQSSRSALICLLFDLFLYIFAEPKTWKYTSVGPKVLRLNVSHMPTRLQWMICLRTYNVLIPVSLSQSIDQSYYALLSQ